MFYDIINTGVIFEKEPTGTGKHVLDKILTSPKYENTQLKKIAGALVDVREYDEKKRQLDEAIKDKEHPISLKLKIESQEELDKLEQKIDKTAKKAKRKKRKTLRILLLNLLLKSFNSEVVYDC